MLASVSECMSNGQLRWVPAPDLSRAGAGTLALHGLRLHERVADLVAHVRDGARRVVDEDGVALPVLPAQIPAAARERGAVRSRGRARDARARSALARVRDEARARARRRER